MCGTTKEFYIFYCEHFYVKDIRLKILLCNCYLFCVPFHDVVLAHSAFIQDVVNVNICR